MNESFTLKQVGHLSLEEQSLLTAEDRKWWLKKLEEDAAKRNNAPTSAPDKLPPSPGAPPT